MEIRNVTPLVDAYASRFLKDQPNQAFQEELHSARTTMYRPVVDRYLQTCLRPDLQSFSAVKVDDDVVVAGISFLASAANRSDKVYRNNRPTLDLSRDATFIGELAKLHVNVAEGNIEQISDDYAMTPEEGTAQVMYADANLARLDPRVQSFLAGINYAAFTGRTMATGMALFAEGNDSLDDWTERGVQEAMPHLTISNLAIGEITAHISERISGLDVPLTIVDMGSGSGATLAGIVRGLEKSIQMGASLEDVGATSIAGIEVTTAMMRELAGFSIAATARLSQATGEEVRRTYNRIPTHDIHLNSNELSLFHSGVLEGVDVIKLSEERRNGILLATANYSWHRLPTVSKARIIQSLSAKCKNVIVLVADLVQNASAVNRGYFNFAANGILNCGNIGLEQIFDQNGFSVYDLNEETAPASMNPKLAGQIAQGVTSDSFFSIAWAGDLASAVLWQ